MGLQKDSTRKQNGLYKSQCKMDTRVFWNRNTDLKLDGGTQPKPLLDPAIGWHTFQISGRSENMLLLSRRVSCSRIPIWHAVQLQRSPPLGFLDVDPAHRMSEAATRSFAGILGRIVISGKTLLFYSLMVLLRGYLLALDVNAFPATLVLVKTR